MTRKQHLCAAALAFLATGGASAQSGFSIEGRVPGVKDSAVVRLMNIEDEGRQGKLMVQTVARDGRFRLEGRVASPTLCRVEILGTRIYEDGSTIRPRPKRA